MTIKMYEVVQLKSGGPQMTVVYSPGWSSYKCTWFDNKGKLQKATFPEEALVVAADATRDSQPVTVIINNEEIPF